jgi:hypothetical protein
MFNKKQVAALCLNVDFYTMLFLMLPLPSFYIGRSFLGRRTLGY